MITLLRRIRRNLIQSSSFRKYILYAIGEIALVVIGILIALQINSWNQKRLDALQEKRILQDIVEDLQFYRFLQEAGSERMNEVITSAESLLAKIGNPELPMTDEELSLHIHKLTWIWLAAAPTSIYDALTGSGDFGLITSPALRKKLADLKHNQEKLLQFEEIQSNFVDNQLRPLLNNTVDRTAIRSFQRAGEITTLHYPTPFVNKDWELLLNQEFANLLVDLLFFTNRLINTYERIEVDIDRIDSITYSINPNIRANPYIPY